MALGQAVRAPAQLVVTGDVERTLSFSLDDLRHPPRKTVMALNEHQADKEELYEGVPLAVLLGQAGVPRGPQLRGAAMAAYGLAEGSDGYRVTFSLAELGSGFQDSEVVVAVGGPPRQETGSLGRDASIDQSCQRCEVNARLPTLSRSSGSDCVWIERVRGNRVV